MKFEWFQGEVHLSVPGHQQLIRVQRDTLVKVNQLNGVMVITNEGWAEYSVEDRLNVIQEAGSSLTMVSGEPEGRGLVLSPGAGPRHLHIHRQSRPQQCDCSPSLRRGGARNEKGALPH
ncbi:MAG: hypothetical protein M1451_10490 [Acidobacteria bacterium]|nr:hypothetical protein [Acidobacteriota bacterium]